MILDLFSSVPYEVLNCEMRYQNRMDAVMDVVLENAVSHFANSFFSEGAISLKLSCRSMRSYFYFDCVNLPRSSPTVNRYLQCEWREKDEEGDRIMILLSYVAVFFSCSFQT